MIVRITQNVRDKIKVEVPATEPTLEPPLFLSEWVVNLITLERKSYFLFCEATTLFSVIKSSNRINDQVTFSRLATDVLFEQFKYNANLDIKLFEKLADSVTLFKTNNRKLTGTMNRMAFEAEFFTDDLDHLNDSINGFLDYASPSEAFNKAVAATDLERY